MLPRFNTVFTCLLSWSLVACALDAEEETPELDERSSELATLETFGYNHMPLRGVIPTLVVHVTYDGGLPPPTLTASQLRGQTFGPQFPNLSAYFNEVSSQAVQLRDVGVVELHRSRSELTLPVEERLRQIRASAVSKAIESGVDLHQLDTNPQDGALSNRELLILAYDNGDNRAYFGLNRGVTCAPFWTQRFGEPPRSIDVCSSVALTGGLSFSTYAHEAIHSFGAMDLYGVGDSENYKVSLMGGTPWGLETFHLDPWHKMLFGWIRPRVVDVRVSGWDALDRPSAQRPVNDEVLLLYDPTRGTDEYFMAEYRTNAHAGSYDANTTGSGLSVWRFQLDANKQPGHAPPDGGPAYTCPGYCPRRQQIIRNSFMRQDQSGTLGEFTVATGRLSVTTSGNNNIDLFVDFSNGVSCASNGPGSNEQCVRTVPAGTKATIRLRGSGIGRNDYHLEVEGLVETDVAAHMLSAPDLMEGGNVYFGSGQSTPVLRWSDGTRTGTRFHVNPFTLGANSIGVNWSNDDNYLLDPGFEWQHYRALGWPWAAQGNTGVDLNLGNQRSGSNNGFAWTGERDWNAITQYVPMPTDDCFFRFTGYVRTSPNVTHGYFGVRDGETWELLAEVPFSSAGGYTKLDVPVFTKCRPSVRVYAGYWGPGGFSWIHADDLSLSRM